MQLFGSCFPRVFLALGIAAFVLIVSHSSVTEGALPRSWNARWPNGVIKYKLLLVGADSDSVRHRVLKYMRTIESHTCVRFQEVQSSITDEDDYGDELDVRPTLGDQQRQPGNQQGAQQRTQPAQVPQQSLLQQHQQQKHNHQRQRHHPPPNTPSGRPSLSQPSLLSVLETLSTWQSPNLALSSNITSRDIDQLSTTISNGRGKYVLITNQLSCEAEVGYQGRIQIMFVNAACRKRNLYRVFLNLLGFTDESGRRDLSRYVAPRDASEPMPPSFDSTEQLLVMPFDPQSVLMPVDSWQKFMPLDNTVRWPVTDGQSPSALDYESINLFYGCSAKIADSCNTTETRRMTEKMRLEQQGKKSCWKCTNHQQCGSNGLCRWSSCTFLQPEGSPCVMNEECQSRYCGKASKLCEPCRVTADCNELACITNPYALAPHSCEFPPPLRMDMVIKKCETHEDCGDMAFCQYRMCFNALPEGSDCHHNIQCQTRLCGCDPDDEFPVGKRPRNRSGQSGQNNNSNKNTHQGNSSNHTNKHNKSSKSHHHQATEAASSTPSRAIPVAHAFQNSNSSRAENPFLITDKCKVKKCMGCQRDADCSGRFARCLRDKHPAVRGRCESKDELFGQLMVACNEDKQCGFMAYCDARTHRCRPAEESGQPCHTNAQCASHLCRNNKCSSCAADDECERIRFCVNEKCLVRGKDDLRRIAEEDAQLKAYLPNDA